MVKVTDVNDSMPIFEQSAYDAFLSENNSPGLSILSLRASDADWKQNARVS